MERENLVHDFVPSQGLGSAKRAVDAWTRALSVLPVEGLTPVEKKQRDQYDFELAAAKAKLVDMEANPKNPEGMMTIRSWEHEKLPWKRAAAIIPDLIASQTWNSSVGHFFTYPPPYITLTHSSGCRRG